MSAPKPESIVGRDEWLAARKALLEKEMELTRLSDAVAEQRRRLPWTRVEQNYLFTGPNGRESLADLFAGRSQLVVYHFMFGPGWKEGCPNCSLLGDHADAAWIHLAARDVSLVLVSRAPYAEIAPFKARMGWRIHWVSSAGSTFNRDHHVSFTREEVASGKPLYNYGLESFPNEEAGGISVFAKDERGDVFHTYSAYDRTIDQAIGVNFFLDIVPKGRDEAGLPWPGAWVRHHDSYGKTAPG